MSRAALGDPPEAGISVVSPLQSQAPNSETLPKSGILVINLPSVQCSYFTAEYGDDEKQLIYPEIGSWTSIQARAEQARRFPHLPERIIDNLVAPYARISVVPWERLSPERLKFLVDATFDGRGTCEYDLTRQMRRRNA